MDRKLRTAVKLMDSFAQRTGITGRDTGKRRRYLWTDAFAVQTFFGLYRSLNKQEYRERALELIELVHEHLGKHHPEDERSGWISDLPEEKAQKHPTAGGLRIGKDLPERKKEEQFNEQLEWNRDGQYFHYLTRWFDALLLAGQERNNQGPFLLYAKELLEAGTNFITGEQPLRMYWKMSTDLQRPLVRSMGAQDPLDGLLATLSLKATEISLSPHLQQAEEDFRQLCEGQEWRTIDPLGIGGLLINTAKVFNLTAHNIDLPASVQPEKLLRESLESLAAFSNGYHSGRTAEKRLAFRECGLSLGIRVLAGQKATTMSTLEEYLSLADEIEGFWSRSSSRESATWQDHLDINAVTLAASLTAYHAPEAFTPLTY